MEKSTSTEQLPSSEVGAPWILRNARGVNFYSDEKSGKWCIVRDSSSIDAAWKTVCTLLDSGALVAAKVSTGTARRLTGHTTQVICVYTRDWSNKPDVFRTREVLRAVGFTERLNYKRDVDTMNPDLNPEREFFYED
jgi:hypothetical protein